MSATEKQIDGEHYVNCAIQPTEYILANNLGWCEANVVKYVTRWKSKGGVKDLKKAIHYLEMLIEHKESQLDWRPRPGTDLAPSIEKQKPRS